MPGRRSASRRVSKPAEPAGEQGPQQNAVSVQETLGDMMAAVRDLSEEVAALRRQRRGDRRPSSPPLKRPALQQQYKVNASALNELDSAIQETDGQSPAMQALESCKDTLEKRQKILRIADRYGWDTVEAYDGAKGLGDDPADEKRISEAAATARRQQGQGRVFFSWIQLAKPICPFQKFQVSTLPCHGGINWIPRTRNQL